MTTELPPAPPEALPATLTLSKSNIRDFIRARGVNVPVIVAGQSLIDFIIRTAQDCAFNIIKVPTKLKSDCQRAGQTAAKQALLEWVNQKFPMPEERCQGFQLNGIPEKLPRYTEDNGMIVACEAAEKAIRPWVWGGAHHANPKRQAAGVAAAAARKAAEEPALPDDGTRAIEPIAVAPVAIVEEMRNALISVSQKNQAGVISASESAAVDAKVEAAIKLANTEFETSGDVPFSSAGTAVSNTEKTQDILTVDDLVAADQPLTLDHWLAEHGLRTMELEGTAQPWICMMAGLSNESIGSAAGMKAALKQNLVVPGMTELQACFNYAGKQEPRLPWPDSLALALEQQTH